MLTGRGPGGHGLAASTIVARDPDTDRISLATELEPRGLAAFSESLGVVTWVG